MQITLRGQPILTMDQFKHSKTHTALLKCGQMLIDDRPLVFRYAMPIVTVGAASLLASLLPWRVDPSHFTLYFLAVVVSAWYGGVGAGLLSTVLSALALDYYFISPIYSIEMDAHALVRLCVFLSVSIITNILTNARRRAETALRQAHMELEDRVEERTAELAQTNSALREEISERQKLEKELYRVQHQIGRVERLATLGRMTGTVAHDLGTPLNSVLGYTQLLAQEDLPERARRRLAIIETQIHRMGEIIQNYLAYTRGNPPQEIIHVNDLIRDTLLLLQPVFKQRDVQVGTQLGESLPPVLGDGNSIQRVLINLLDNAIDACEQRGSVTLRTYTAENSLQQRQDVVIECADSGAGIEAEILPKVFELFVTTKAPGKGTGMGLVICQEIVRAHGGDINIKSDPTTGTVVTVFLPVNVNSQSAADTEERHEHSHTDS